MDLRARLATGVDPPTATLEALAQARLAAAAERWHDSLANGLPAY